MATNQKAQTAARTIWQADPFHTQGEFAAKHLGMMTVMTVMTVRRHFPEVKVAGHIDPLIPKR